ncbi:hypothetical protein BDA96_10G268600 [Sorghum bicolor]|uniref:Uncharacterized protein n=1 Tax=Sorghum bicolor TaxID=4558 RepID=A0A921Q500_SORBI|nr:hypothetical protein BDA96_10G268600 [Sorghum bicolor]
MCTSRSSFDQLGELRLRRQGTAMGPSGRSWLLVLLVCATLCAHVSAASDTTVLAAERTRRKDPPRRAQVLHGRRPGFSAAPVVRRSRALWFVAVAAAALQLLSYSRRVFAPRSLLLLVFTAAAVASFNGSTTATLDLRVSQADGRPRPPSPTSTGLLADGEDGRRRGLAARRRRAGHSNDVARRVAAASRRAHRSRRQHSRRIRTALDTMDTCVAMDEWVAAAGQSHTAWSPTCSNRDVPAQVGLRSYNQSGPRATLCSPYNSDLSDRPCAAGEVTADNAQQAPIEEKAAHSPRRPYRRV